MFGYVRPFKPELKVKEFETYNAVYCGLCHQLGRSFGVFARFTLSYDFAFLAMLYMSVEPACPSFKSCSCFANPLKKKMCCTSERALSFSADAAAVLMYYKVKDNIADSGWFKGLLWRALLPFAASARKRAMKRSGETDEIFAQMMTEQTAAEQNNADCDESAEPTARAMARLMTLLPTENATQRRVLERMGYLVGRYVYLCDACDDLEDDIKKGGFNPLKAAGSTDDGKKRAQDAIYLTIAELQAAFALLETQRYETILDNIVSLGLKNRADMLISGEKAAMKI